MKKGVKIFLGIFIFLILAVGAVGGTLFYSYKQLDYSVGNTELTNHITLDISNYVGYIEIKTQLSISYNGLYALRDLSIDIEVYGYNFSLTPSLDGEQLGKGNNTIGDITKGDTWDDYILTNVTQYISVLAVEDCDMEIHIFISVKIDFFIFKMPLQREVIVVKHWNSPF
ncbi:MAG: hypothetical protein ACTSYD_10040 [Candidatus Heimdallarchaeaceae archaeon]